MGADGHIAIYDWHKVKEYIEAATEHWVAKWKHENFRLEDISLAKQFVSELDIRFPQHVPHRITARSAAKFGEFGGGYSTYVDGCKCEWLQVSYRDELDREPCAWPGYVCNWTCNGRPACLIYWGDNIYSDPWEEHEWLRDWCEKNALLVRDQEVWT